MTMKRHLLCSVAFALAAAACGSDASEIATGPTSTITAPTTTLGSLDSTSTSTSTSSSPSTSTPPATIPDLDCSLAPIADFAPLEHWARDEVLVLAEQDFDGDGTTEALVNPAGNTSQSAVLVRRNGCELEEVPHLDVDGTDIGILSYSLIGNSNLGATADLLCVPALGGGIELVNVWTSAATDIAGAADPLAALDAWRGGSQDLNVAVDRWRYDGVALRQTHRGAPGFAFAATHAWPYLNDFACNDRPTGTTVLPVDDAGVGPVPFGSTVAEARAALEPLIGPPLSDSGYNYLPVVYCSDGSVQVVSWGGLTLTFTDESFGSHGPGLVEVDADHSMWPATSGATFAGYECVE